MSSEFIDLTAPALHMKGPKPRGLLPVPALVEEIVAKQKNLSHPCFDEKAEKQMRDDFTLQYYYEWDTVACRITPQGVEVLAVGTEEIGVLLKEIPPELRPGVVVKQV
jgi:hypothetical protein